MDLEALYTDKSFNELLTWHKRKANIHDFDAFKQDVFLELLEEGAETFEQAKRISRRVVQRYWREYRRARDKYNVPLQMPFYENEPDVDDFMKMNPNRRIEWAYSEGLIPQDEG